MPIVQSTNPTSHRTVEIKNKRKTTHNSPALIVPTRPPPTDIPTNGQTDEGTDDERQQFKVPLPLHTVPSKPRTSANQRTPPPSLSLPRGRRRRHDIPTDEHTDVPVDGECRQSKYQSLPHIVQSKPRTRAKQRVFIAPTRPLPTDKPTDGRTTSANISNCLLYTSPSPRD